MIQSIRYYYTNYLCYLFSLLTNIYITETLCIFREALTRGIYTEKTLRDRFFRVEKMANRTALIKDEQSSLFMYLLSYMQSLVMTSPSTEKV